MRFGLLAAFVILAVAVWPATGSGFKIPKLPKTPKITSYPVTVDVAGYVDFEWTFDNRSDCYPGYAKSVTEELSFEFGRPVRTSVNVFDGAVTMPYATGGEAKVKVKAGGFQTTNYCPPTAPNPEPPDPDCRTLTGKLGATLLPEPTEGGDDALVPLGHGVNLTLIRKGGGLASQSCLKDRPRLRSPLEDKGVSIETTAPLGPLTVPLGSSSAKFTSLKRNDRISRTIKIGGGCASPTVATSSRLSEYITRCTIAGRIVVVIKRVG